MYYKILKRIEPLTDIDTGEHYCKDYYRVQFKRYFWNKWKDAFYVQYKNRPGVFPEVYSSVKKAKTALSGKKYIDSIDSREKWSSYQTWREDKQI